MGWLDIVRQWIAAWNGSTFHLDDIYKDGRYLARRHKGKNNFVEAKIRQSLQILHSYGEVCRGTISGRYAIVPREHAQPQRNFLPMLPSEHTEEYGTKRAPALKDFHKPSEGRMVQHKPARHLRALDLDLKSQLQIEHPKRTVQEMAHGVLVVADPQDRTPDGVLFAKGVAKGDRLREDTQAALLLGVMEQHGFKTIIYQEI